MMRDSVPRSARPGNLLSHSGCCGRRSRHGTVLLLNNIRVRYLSTLDAIQSFRIAMIDAFKADLEGFERRFNSIE